MKFIFAGMAGIALGLYCKDALVTVGVISAFAAIDNIILQINHP